MKKNVLIVGLLVLTIFLFNITVFAEESGHGKDTFDLAPSAKSGILIERDTGKVMFEKKAHEPLPPASMTKIMTMLLIMEEIDKGNLKKNEMIRISENAASMGGSQIFLEAGEEMSVDDLLKGIAVASANDASVALAERISGSEEAFVKRMNQKVKELGLKNTKFQNVSGLPAKDHYSTAYDMAMMAKELLSHESITKYTSIYEDYLRKGTDNEFWLVNTNKLVRFYPGVDGLKTGFTSEAKYCLTATAKKNDMRVVAVVMGAETPKERNSTISNMLDYAFNTYETKKLFNQNDRITELNVLKAAKRKIDVVASQSISMVFKKGESIEKLTTSVQLDEVKLPIKKGTKVGTLHVKNGDKSISETPLIINEDVDKASYFTLFKRSIQKLSKND
ncbi:D-alanyl-D-alanine carboxypeptidase family protein [Ornithinibacillus bavariensis]|uniref:serine-type D-Ala-D-Ala carboxypeptidase n=1 Tax=Ornithinibacillus bavariensis TaxID=545502 RepID=A0A919XBS5_9BACI|nr:D-alanyl-D-alanine carboxypeptidase family protein [Ornithinibacillus bavariensis]GIO28508.1 D-alanyl-D-alanine carboxypeptidase [Ornithinibacillus bavariensis]HAM81236.1 D-alanyl-D-alanine carboxypeptidase [Ornithinibacillus sp.]